MVTGVSVVILLAGLSAPSLAQGSGPPVPGTSQQQKSKTGGPFRPDWARPYPQQPLEVPYRDPSSIRTDSSRCPKDATPQQRRDLGCN
jgi:hypothetical protein